jgi:hypothetical protein
VEELGIPLTEEVAKEGAQVDQVLLHGTLGAALDDGLIAGKFPHDGGKFADADLVAHGEHRLSLVFSVHYYTKILTRKSGQTVNFKDFVPMLTKLSQLIFIW